MCGTCTFREANKQPRTSQQRLVPRWRVCARDSCVQGKDLSSRRVVGETTLTRRGRRQRIIKACKELLLLYAALSQSIVVKAGRHLDSEITIYAPLGGVSLSSSSLSLPSPSRRQDLFSALVSCVCGCECLSEAPRGYSGR